MTSMTPGERSGFGITSKVSYKHQAYEFRIPKAIIGNDNIEFKLGYYGTSAVSYSISGQVTTGGGSGLDGVTITFDSGGTPETATTSGGGYYSYTVGEGWAGTVTPSLTNYSFTPAFASIGPVNSNVVQDFVGTVSEVWVDDDWAGTNSGSPVGGHTFGYDAFDIIQDGINSVTASGTVNVADGTYTENILWDSKDLAILGSGTPGCIVNGGSMSSVIIGRNLTGASVLEGFTITNGSGTPTYIPAFGVTRICGGGLHLTAASPRITDCAIAGNTAIDYGGGMFNLNSDPVLTDCAFSANFATSGSAGGGGGMSNVASDPTLANCSFSGNSANGGGGMSNFDSDPTLANCSFSGNSATSGSTGGGGGMYNSSGDPTLANCSFSGNSATFGGGMYNSNGSDPTLTNCSFADNTAASSGGGMYNCDSFNSTLTNCSFANNSAASYGGGMYNLTSDPTLANCILWGDTASSGSEIYNDIGTPSVTYSNIQGGYAGTGNINQDPLFVNATGGDFHLQPTSPCINAGTNAAANLPATDFEGDTRIIGGTVDMGVDETIYVPPVISTLLFTTPIDEGTSGTLSCTASTTIIPFDLEIVWGDGTGTQTFGYPAGTANPSAIHGYTNSGTHNITVTLKDVHGTCNTLSTMITVNNLPPTANDDAYVIDEDIPLTVPAPGVLDNDDDPGNDVLTVTSVDTTGLKGTLTSWNPNGSFIYYQMNKFETLMEGDTAIETFTYLMSDGDGGTDTTTVTITIEGVDDTYPLPVNLPLEITIDPPEGGTVDQSPSGTIFVMGTSVTLNAIPAEGYLFNGWDGDLTGSGNPETITMNSNKSIIASFVLSGSPAEDIEDEEEPLPEGNVPVNDQGVTGQTVSITGDCLDCNGTLIIPAGTIALDAYGNPLTNVTVQAPTVTPANPEGVLILGICDFGPDGATFDPPITVKINYDPGTLPEGIEPEDLVLAYYDEVSGEWVELADIVVDTINHTISGHLAHFTQVGMLAQAPVEPTPIPTLTPEPTVEPTPTPTVEPKETPEPTQEPPPPIEEEDDDGGMNLWMIIIPIVAILILGLGIYLILLKKGLAGV